MLLSSCDLSDGGESVLVGVQVAAITRSRSSAMALLLVLMRLVLLATVEMLNLIMGL